MNEQYWAFVMPAVVLIGMVVLVVIVAWLLFKLAWWLRWKYHEWIIQSNYTALGGDPKAVQKAARILGCSRQQAAKWVVDKIREVEEEKRLAEKWK